MKNTFNIRKEIYIKDGYNLVKELYKTKRYVYDEVEKDGYHFKVYLKNWQDGYRPNIVDKRNPYSIENIKNFIKINGIKSTLISNEYKDNKTKLLFKCGCGKEYEASWTHFSRGNNWKCNTCALKDGCTTRPKLKDIKEKVIKAGFIPLFDNYQNSSQKLKIMNKDGYILEALINNINTLRGEDIVTPKNSHSIYNIKKFIKNNGYTCELLSNEYKDKRTRLKLRCKCGEIFYTTWESLKSQHTYRCRKCSNKQSFYELKTEEWLIENSYKYRKEVTFEGCKNKRKLPFDFQVFLEDDSYCLIEIDGVFHYRPQYSEERFKEQKERDEIKNKFCRDNNIPLLRINYWRFREPYSYKQILKDFLDSLQQP